MVDIKDFVIGMDEGLAPDVSANQVVIKEPALAPSTTGFQESQTFTHYLHNVVRHPPMLALDFQDIERRVVARMRYGDLIHHVFHGSNREVMSLFIPHIQECSICGSKSNTRQRRPSLYYKCLACDIKNNPVLNKLEALINDKEII